jgi:hypothetical protein
MAPWQLRRDPEIVDQIEAGRNADEAIAIHHDV